MANPAPATSPSKAAAQPFLPVPEGDGLQARHQRARHADRVGQEVGRGDVAVQHAVAAGAHARDRIGAGAVVGQRVQPDPGRVA